MSMSSRVAKKELLVDMEADEAENFGDTQDSTKECEIYKCKAHLSVSLISESSAKACDITDAKNDLQDVKVHYFLQN